MLIYSMRVSVDGFIADRDGAFARGQECLGDMHPGRVWRYRSRGRCPAADSGQRSSALGSM
jgi:hypothetical protein